jgi:hypothetical protein
MQTGQRHSFRISGSSPVGSAPSKEERDRFLGKFETNSEPNAFGFLRELPSEITFMIKPSRADLLQVGVVKPDNSVELHDIKVGRDFGTTIEIVQGVTPSDKVILIRLIHL